MLIHKLTKFIVNNADNNVIIDVGDHPFSGIADSQVILTFKKQKLKISVVQMTEKSKLYVCIIAKKSYHSSGEYYEWKEVWFKPDTNDKYVPQIWTFIQKMAENSDKFRSKSMPISYKEAIECLSKEIKNNKKH